VKVSSAGVALTATGRQKLARLEMARAAVLRRIARGLEMIESDRSKLVIEALGVLIDQAERVVEEQLGQKPRLERRPSSPPRARSMSGSGPTSGIHTSLAPTPTNPNATVPSNPPSSNVASVSSASNGSSRPPHPGSV
jgi:hypothetical protein